MQPGEGNALLKTTLTHSDGTEYSFVIKGGDKNILETPIGVQPVTPGGPRKFGDYDPSFGNVEMKTWERGWGGEDFSDDESRFQFAKNMWTATKNVMCNVPEFYLADDTTFGRTAISTFNSRPWIGSLTPSGTGGFWASSKFTTVDSFDAKYIHTRIRYLGSGTMTVTACLYSDSPGSPATLLATSDQKQITQSEYGIFVALTFTFSTAYTLSATTNYWVVFKIGVESADSNSVVRLVDGESSYGPGKISYNSGSSWSIHNDIGYIVAPLRGNRRFKFFSMMGTMFALAIYNSGTNRLYMMGDHGIATAGGASTLTDSNKGIRTSWASNLFAGDLITIVSGTGAGQTRTISSNDTAGVITVSVPWDTTPDTTSEYAITSYTEWHEIATGTHGISNSKSVAVGNKVAYFSMKYGTAIKRMRFNPTTSGLDFASDGTNDADVIYVANGKVWKGTDDDGIISHAPLVDWGTNLTFTALTLKTPTASSFNGIAMHSGQIYFFKDDGMWFCDGAGTVLYQYPVSMQYFTNSNNGRYSVSHQEWLYFSWGPSMQRLSGLSMENVDPNRDGGMDASFRGTIGGLADHPAGVFFAVNGGEDNSSSVNIFDGFGFHNAFTLDFPGQQITDISWVNVEDNSPVLLIACGDHVYYQKYPLNTTNPLHDSDLFLASQGELTTSIIDMGGKGIKKFFKDLVAFVKNVFYIPPTYYSEVNIYYNADDAGWVYLDTIQNVTRSANETTFTDPTLSTINALSNIRELRLKFVIFQADPTSSKAQIYAVTLKGFARTPIKSVFSFPVDVSSVTNRLGSGDPVTMMADLFSWAESAEALLLTSQHNRLHNKSVIIIPRSVRTQYIDRSNENFAGTFFLELREV